MSLPGDGNGALSSRAELRKRLLAARDAFVRAPEASSALAALRASLVDTLVELEPACIGLYSPLGSESYVADAIGADARLCATPLALPYARREGRTMVFRRWRPGDVLVADECGIGSSRGSEVEPDVVVVPCVGYTAEGHRLGYGGGYFDRWLATRPHVTAVGVAWSFAEIAPEALDAQAHDVPLSVIVTEHGVR